jgi:hypothetical protein
MNPRRFAAVATVLVLLTLVQWLSAQGQGQQPNQVEVVNTPSVVDINHPAFQPHQHQCDVVLTSGVASSANLRVAPPCTEFMPPTGKRLVIELVTVRAIVPAGQIPSLMVGTSMPQIGGGSFKILHRMDLGAAYTSTVIDRYFATLPVRLYADFVDLTMLRDNSSGEAHYNVTWSGHFVDLS